MLVLSRKLGEDILIGDNIVVTVVEIDRGRVRLGVIAPGLSVDRPEVRALKLASNPHYSVVPVPPPLPQVTAVEPTSP